MRMKVIGAIALVALIAIIAGAIWRLAGPAPAKTLRIIGEDVPPLAALAEVAKEYSQRTGIKVEIEKYEFQTAVQKATQDMSTGGGHYDIVLLPHLALGRFVTGAGVTEISTIALPPDSTERPPSPTAVFENVAREISTYRGRQYGLPYTANTMYVAYRRDLFEDPANRTAFEGKYGYKLAAPETWQQYRDIAEFFTRPGDKLFGTALQAKRHPSVWYEWLNFAYSFGGGVLDATRADAYGKIIINCPDSVRATDFYRALTKFSPVDTATYTWDEHLAAVQQGRVAMVIMWSDTIPSLEVPSQSRVAGKMGYAPVPASPVTKQPMPQIAGWSYFVSSKSKNQARAAEFIYWMMQPENQIAQQKLGGASALKATYNDPTIKAIPYTTAYVRSLELARSMSSSFPETEQVADQVQACISELISNPSADTRAVLNQCAAGIRNVLRAHADAELACKP